MVSASGLNKTCVHQVEALSQAGPAIISLRMFHMSCGLPVPLVLYCASLHYVQSTLNSPGYCAVSLVPCSVVGTAQCPGYYAVSGVLCSVLGTAQCPGYCAVSWALRSVRSTS